jgi:hypothetical protein
MVTFKNVFDSVIRQHSSVLDVRSFSAADCDTIIWWLQKLGRGSQCANKERNRFRMVKFSLKKLNWVEGKEKYRVEISFRFAALENLDAEVDIDGAWETIGENMEIDAEVDIGGAWETIGEIMKISTKESLGCYELKHKPWFVEGCLEFLDQRGKKTNCSG